MSAPSSYSWSRDSSSLAQPRTPQGPAYLIWAGILKPYIKSQQSDLCPSGPAPASPGADTRNFDGIYDTLTNDYADHNRL